jgi:hypothetical protein
MTVRLTSEVEDWSVDEGDWILRVRDNKQLALIRVDKDGRLGVSEHAVPELHGWLDEMIDRAEVDRLETNRIWESS